MIVVLAPSGDRMTTEPFHDVASLDLVAGPLKDGACATQMAAAIPATK